MQLGRPVNTKKAKRRTFTTMLDPVLRDEIKIQAIREGKSAADLIEDIIRAYLTPTDKP